MKTRTVSVRGLTEGAILAALVALLAVATRYVPVLGLAAGLVCPLPLAALVIRHRVRVGILAAIVAAVIGGIIAGPLVSAAIVLAFSPLGIMLGIGVSRGWSAARIVLAGSLVSTAGILASLGITLAISGVNPYLIMIESMRQSQQVSSQFYAGLGLPPEQIERASGQMRQVIELLPRLIPMMVAVGGISTAYLNVVVGRAVLGRFGYRLPSLSPMREWSIPGPMMWVFVVGFALMAWGGTLSPSLQSAGLNLTVLAQMAFAIQGLIVGWVLMERYHVAGWLRWIPIVLALTNPLFGLAAFFLGLADSAFMLRERWRTGAAERSVSERL